MYSSEKILAFWDFESRRGDHYFSSTTSPQIIKIAKLFFPLKGKSVIDYGAGAGHLAEKLLKFGCNIIAIEPSKSSKVEIENRCAKRVLVSQYISNVISESIDVIFSIGVIEHIDETMFANTLKEMNRVLKPGGYIFFHTLHNEPMENNMIKCPECGEVFHRYLHVRTFNKKFIDAEINSSIRIKQIFCGSLDLQYYERIAFWNRPIRQFIRMGWIFILRTIDTIFQSHLSLIWHCRSNIPNDLIWIGQKEKEKS